jgi:hypothetical protein
VVADEQDAGGELPRSRDLDAVSRVGLDRLREAIAAVLGTPDCAGEGEAGDYGVGGPDCCPAGGHAEDGTPG